MEKDDLDHYHSASLDQESVVVVCTKPIKDSRSGVSQDLCSKHFWSYFVIDATSIMRGISRENPEEDRVRCIE